MHLLQLTIGISLLQLLSLLLLLSNSNIQVTNGLQIGQLLSTCVNACERGCTVIRDVQAARVLQDGNDGSGSDGSDNGSLKVELKDVNDPRSALTEADSAAQMQIVGSLRLTWEHNNNMNRMKESDDFTTTTTTDSSNNKKLRIIGEEDDTNDEDAIMAFIQNKEHNKPLNKDLFDDDMGETVDIDMDDITIYVDPLDGTREFVEGRLENCQVLIGIAIGGSAVAGVIGIPFPSGNMSTNPTIIYGIDNIGTGVIGSTLTRGPYPLERNIDGVKYPRPHHATGDSDAIVMDACRKGAIRAFGGSNVIYGGAGNKILAAALGEVASSIQHKVGGPWDLCAPEAILKSMGGRMTDLFGEDIAIYDHDHDHTTTSRCNERGYLATPPGYDETYHKALAAAMVALPEVQEYRKGLDAN